MTRRIASVPAPAVMNGPGAAARGNRCCDVFIPVKGGREMGTHELGSPSKSGAGHSSRGRWGEEELLGDPRRGGAGTLAQCPPRLSGLQASGGPSALVLGGTV